MIMYYFFPESNNQYFSLKHSNGNKFRIRKGYLCKIYQAKDHVSVDRLYRFRSTPLVREVSPNDELFVSIDDWALFKTIPYVCHVLYFKNLSKRTKKESTNKNMTVDLTDDNKENVGAMCNLFTTTFINNERLDLNLSDTIPFVIPLSHFISKISKPFIGDDEKFFIDNTAEVQQILSHNVI